jgi:hypothetical protein
LFSAFRHFLFSFQEIKKLDGSKSEKLKAPFLELLSFSFLGSSSFWICQKLIQKSDEKVKQTCPKEMVEKGYFSKGGARRQGTKTVSEPGDDEVMVYEDFFVAGLRMLPHLVLSDILLHFQAQLHQLTPNVIAQLSKYFWVVGRFRGVPFESGFVKWYELHYQPKIVETPEGSRITQYGCLNFHAKRDDSQKLSLTIKNKWS